MNAIGSIMTTKNDTIPIQNQNDFKFSHSFGFLNQAECKNINLGAILQIGQSMFGSKFGTSNFGNNLWTSVPNVNFGTV